MELLKFDDVSKVYFNKDGVTKVLDSISLSIEEGKIYSILGPSGCGKTSILNLISGLITPTSGTIIKPDSIGYMFQRDNLFDWLTILDNVTLGLKIQKNKNEKTIKLGLEINKSLTKENIAYVEDLIKKYGLEEFIYAYPNSLSGGMRQRVALIRAIVTKPKLLLLDEPFSALDAQTRLAVSQDIYQIIKELQITTVIVTHDLSEAISLSDSIYLLSNRPAKIKGKYEIGINSYLPIERRNLSEFQTYFHEIWGEING